MSAMKWLNNLLFIENLLGIYRKYCNRTKIKKCLIIFQTVVQIIIHSFNIIGVIIFLVREGIDQMNLIYGSFITLACVNCVSSVVIGICYSRDFVSYYQSISRISGCFADDNKFTGSLKKIYWFSVTFFLFSIIFVAYRSSEVLVTFSLANPLFSIVLLASQTISRLNIVLQHLILFVVIMLVVNSLKCLSSLVSVVQERVRRGISWDEQCCITREQIQSWVELYRDLANCCEKVTLCFGCQFFFTLTMSITSHVLIAYQMCYKMVLMNGNTVEFKKMTLSICVYTFLMMMPIVAGQMTCNQGMKFHKVMARLYNSVIIIDSSESEAKLIKDFLRLIKNNPIEIKLTSKVPTGMYMLPVLLTLLVNYVIIMLQFNHVI